MLDAARMKDGIAKLIKDHGAHNLSAKTVRSSSLDLAFPGPLSRPSKTFLSCHALAVPLLTTPTIAVQTSHMLYPCVALLHHPPPLSIRSFHETLAYNARPLSARTWFNPPTLSAQSTRTSPLFCGLGAPRWIISRSTCCLTNAHTPSCTGERKVGGRAGNGARKPQT